jgi:hypothetical protein
MLLLVARKNCPLVAAAWQYSARRGGEERWRAFFANFVVDLQPSLRSCGCGLKQQLSLLA